MRYGYPSALKIAFQCLLEKTIGKFRMAVGLGKCDDWKGFVFSLSSEAGVLEFLALGEFVSSLLSELSSGLYKFAESAFVDTKRLACTLHGYFFEWKVYVSGVEYTRLFSNIASMTALTSASSLC